MKNISKILFGFSFILLLKTLPAHGQSDYLVVDSCGSANNAIGITGMDETIILSTDTGMIQINRQKYDENSPWVLGYSINAYLTDQFLEFDSTGRMITRNIFIIDSAGWHFTKRTIFSYDLSGTMNDSIVQLLSNGNWTNSEERSWQRDNAGNLLFTERKIWNNNAWEYQVRRESYFDAANRDTLDIDYNGNGQTWVPANKTSRIFTASGLSEQLSQTWNGAAWQNLNLQQWYFAGVNMDTLYIHLQWNSTQWDTTSLRMTTFDTQNLRTSQTSINHVGTIWLNDARTFWTYDMNDSVITIIQQLGDSSNWVNYSLDSTEYVSATEKITFHQTWDTLTSTWICKTYIDHYSWNPLSYNDLFGDLNPSDCSMQLYSSSSSFQYDSLGRIVQKYEWGTGYPPKTYNYTYDSDGFVTYSSVQSEQSFAGGPTVGTYYGCIHRKPLIVLFSPSAISACPGDSLHLTPFIINGSHISQYEWKFDSIPFQNPSPNFSGIAGNKSGWYYLTCHDSTGNYFSDSIFVQVHPEPSLGKDSIVCLPGSITLYPGHFPSYVWQDGSTDSTFSISSTATDTLLVTVTVTDASCLNSDSALVIFDNCIGINTIDEINLSVFPNPIHDGQEFKIYSDRKFTSLSIRGVSGEILFHSKNSTNEIILPGLSKGIYILELSDDRKRYVRKLVVQ